MESIVNNRLKKFKTLEKGIEYMYKNGVIRNINSARISVPPLFELRDNFYSCKIPKTLMLAGIERMDKYSTNASKI